MGRSERLVVFAAINKMLILLVIFSHIIACLWYLVGKLGSQGSRLGDSHSLIQRYMQSFHSAISIFFGENVVQPRNLADRVFASVCLCFTFTLQIWFVSFITTAM